MESGASLPIALVRMEIAENAARSSRAMAALAGTTILSHEFSMVIFGEFSVFWIGGVERTIFSAALSAALQEMARQMVVASVACFMSLFMIGSLVLFVGICQVFFLMEPLPLHLRHRCWVIPFDLDFRFPNLYWTYFFPLQDGHSCSVSIMVRFFYLWVRLYCVLDFFY